MSYSLVVIHELNSVLETQYKEIIIIIVVVKSEI